MSIRALTCTVTYAAYRTLWRPVFTGCPSQTASMKPAALIDINGTTPR